MKKAIKDEINKLMKRGVFDIVLREELPKNANILGGRFVLAIKDPNTKEERYKARLVVQGHRDRHKPYLVHASPNLKQDTVRMIISLASIMGFEL